MNFNLSVSTPTLRRNLFDISNLELNSHFFLFCMPQEILYIALCPPGLGTPDETLSLGYKI